MMQGINNITSQLSEEVLLDAAVKGDAEMVKLCLTHGINPAAENNAAISCAAQNGHSVVIKLLIADDRVNSAYSSKFAITAAIQYGHSDVVKLLLTDERVEAADLNFTFCTAIRSGQTEMVKLLLADHRVNPAANDNAAIKKAAHYGHPDILILLLEHPAVIAYVCKNLQDFITKNPAIKNALTSSHANYNEAFRTKFFSLVSKEFMSTIPNYLAALHANGLPNDVIVLNIAPHLHFYFERYKEKVMNPDEKVKISSDDIILVNQSYALLPSQTTKSDDQDSKEELSYHQTKSPTFRKQCSRGK